MDQYRIVSGLIPSHILFKLRNRLPTKIHVHTHMNSTSKLNRILTSIIIKILRYQCMYKLSGY